MIDPVTAVLTRPTTTADGAAAVLASRWGIRGDLAPLPSERDRNFLVSTTHGAQWVLKLANLAEERRFLDLQHMAMAQVAAGGVPCQQPVPTLDGSLVADAGAGGGPPLARLLTWLPGLPLADLDPSARTESLLRELGATMGHTAIALRDIDGTAANRAFQWDVLRGESVIEAHASAVEGDRRRLLDTVGDRLRASLWPRLPALRRSLIHNDANDHNVLVDPAARRLSGLLDFGDMVHSVTVNEAAVAAAYALLGATDPLAATVAVVAGFHSVLALEPAERAIVFELVIARLATSAALSAHQARLDPRDAYLTVSESGAWTALERLQAIHPDGAEAAITAGCR